MLSRACARVRDKEKQHSRCGMCVGHPARTSASTRLLMLMMQRGRQGHGQRLWSGREAQSLFLISNSEFLSTSRSISAQIWRLQRHLLVFSRRLVIEGHIVAPAYARMNSSGQQTKLIKPRTKKGKRALEKRAPKLVRPLLEVLAYRSQCAMLLEFIDASAEQRRAHACRHASGGRGKLRRWAASGGRRGAPDASCAG